MRFSTYIFLLWIYILTVAFRSVLVEYPNNCLRVPGSQFVNFSLDDKRRWFYVLGCWTLGRLMSASKCWRLWICVFLVNASSLCSWLGPTSKHSPVQPYLKCFSFSTSSMSWSTQPVSTLSALFLSPSSLNSELYS